VTIIVVSLTRSYTALGGLKKPVDIYAFGMTIFEVRHWVIFLTS